MSPHFDETDVPSIAEAIDDDTLDELTEVELEMDVIWRLTKRLVKERAELRVLASMVAESYSADGQYSAHTATVSAADIVAEARRLVAKARGEVGR